MAERNIKLKDFQADFMESKARFPAFVAGWGTGKTFSAILKGLDLSKKYPDNLGLILRKNFTDLRDSTMADFKRYTAGSGIRVKVQEKSAEIDTSKILFHHADELAGVIQNINLGWFFIEQAEEFDNEEVFQKLRGRLRRENTSRQGFIIANTNGHNWIWRLWKADPKKEFELYEANTFDNKSNLPHISKCCRRHYMQEDYNTYICSECGKECEIICDFIEDLKEMEEQSPSHFRRYVMNSWEDTDTADKVIPYQKILDAVDRDLQTDEASLRVISCDPAEFGDDKSQIYALKGYGVVDEKTLTKRESMETAGHIVVMSRKHCADVIGIDDTGMGSGIRSRLRELTRSKGIEKLDAQIMALNFGRAAYDRIHYVRLRDQIIMEGAQLFRDDYTSIPNDNILIEELAAFTYSINSRGQMMVCRKKDIKEVLGHSPDKAESLLIGLWCAKRGHRRSLSLVGALQGQEESYDVLRYGL